MSYLIQNVRLFDGVEVHEEPCSIYVSNGQIQSVTTTEPLNVPNGAEIVDGAGCTLLPGLIDAHTHVFRAPEPLKSAIPAGVTTVFDMHNTPEDGVYMKDLARDSIELPQIFSALYAATVRGGWPEAIVRHTVTDPKVNLPGQKCPCIRADHLRFFRH